MSYHGVELEFFTDNARVMVLAATNQPSELDEAILRRLPMAFEIGKPGQSDRAKILKVTLKGERIDENIDFDYIASLCGGFTGSDIFELCKHAAYFPLMEFLQDEKKGKQASVSTPSSSINTIKNVHLLLYQYGLLVYLMFYAYLPKLR